MTAPVSPSQPTAEPVRRCKHDVSEDCPACAEEAIASLKARVEELEGVLLAVSAMDPHGFYVAPMGSALRRRVEAALAPSTPAVLR